MGQVIFGELLLSRGGWGDELHEWISLFHLWDQKTDFYSIWQGELSILGHMEFYRRKNQGENCLFGFGMIRRQHGRNHPPPQTTKMNQNATPKIATCENILSCPQFFCHSFQFSLHILCIMFWKCTISLKIHKQREIEIKTEMGDEESNPSLEVA